MTQGSKINSLSNTRNNLFGSHFDVFHLYNNTSLQFAEFVLN